MTHETARRRSARRTIRTRVASAVLAIGAVAGAAGTASATGAADTTGVAEAPTPEATTTPLPTDRLIVRFRHTPTEADLDVGRLTEVSGTPLELVRTTGERAVVLRLPRRMAHGDVARIAGTLAKQPGVELAIPDDVLMPTAADPLLPSQWHYRFGGTDGWGANAQAAWPRTKGAGVVVAVVDTGRRNHEDLVGRQLDGYDFVTDIWTANDGDGRDADETDPGDGTGDGECGLGSTYRISSWHGVHVTGTIAANLNNGLGGAGVAPEVMVLPVRVLGRCGGYLSDITEGIRWAAGLPANQAPPNPNPADIINLSLGGPGICHSWYQEAIDAVRATGVLVVAAAGNSASDASSFRPANCPGVITVSAGTRAGTLAPYSNSSTTVIDLTAPGGSTSASSTDGVLSASNSGLFLPYGDDWYRWYQGTSMAAPHVAGTLALMMSAAPTATPGELEAALKAGTRPFLPGSPCAVSSACGQGWLDAAAAVDAIAPPPASPTVTLIDASVPERNSGTFKAWVTVQLSHAATTATSVQYRSVAGGTATAGTDYVTRSLSTLTIPAGTTQAGAWVTIKGDTVVESDETVALQFSNPVGLLLADDQAVVTIANDDGGSGGGTTISINDKTVTEPDSGTVNMTFAVKLNAASTQTVTVVATTANGTATSGSDYVTKSVTITFSPGQVTKYVTVAIKGDLVAEPNETLTLGLSGAVNATIADASGLGTITNDD